MEAYHDEVAEMLHAFAPENKPTINGFDLKKYIGTQYDVWGLPVPTQRTLFKEGYTFSSLPVQEQLPIWDAIWKRAAVYEVLCQPLFFVTRYFRKLDTIQLWKVVKGWVKKIDNWAHSDGLSSIYALIMERQPEVVYGQLLKWMTSSNPWERRQTLVTIALYSKKKIRTLSVSQMLAPVKQLLKDEDYFVQKGLGWALREIGNKYPEPTLKFLYKHYGDISSTAFAAAAEKLAPADKEELKQLRKNKRK